MLSNESDRSDQAGKALTSAQTPAEDRIIFLAAVAIPAAIALARSRQNRREREREQDDYNGRNGPDPSRGPRRSNRQGKR